MGLGTLVALLLAEAVVRLVYEGDKGTIGVLYQPSEILGWEHKSGLSMEHESSEFSIEWHLNNHGIRRSQDVELETDRPRIAVLGDSHAAGHGVNEEHSFAARLEEMLGEERSSGVEVLNFAVDGYTSSQQCLWVQHQLERWHLDGLVVAVYLGNDLRENLDTGGLGGYQRPLLDPRTLEVKSSVQKSPRDGEGGDSDGSFAAVKDFLSEHSSLYGFVGNQIRGGPLHERLAEMGLMRPPVPDTARRVLDHVHGAHGQLLWQLQGFEGQPQRQATAVNLTARTLKRMQALCRESEVEFLAVILPCRVEVEGASPELEEAASWLGIEARPVTRIAALRAEFLTALGEQDVQILDLLDAARAYRATHADDPLYYPMDWHLDSAGHRLVAEKVLPVLRNWLD